ncbi:MAG: hypothetical protein KF708_17760 [Pirellulales bacterium]|nr:hypothetical protein [Pirellulales bacterium]
MSSHERLPQELSNFERILAGLAPAPSRIDRDRLMFELGVQSATAPLAASPGGRPSRWISPAGVWAAAAVLLACTSLGLAMRLAAALRQADDATTIAAQTDGPTPFIDAPVNSVAMSVTRDAAERTTARATRSVEEYWLLRVSNPGLRGGDAWRVRPSSSRSLIEPGTPLIVAEARPDLQESASGHPRLPDPQPIPRRLNDRQQWQDWLETFN